MVQLIKKRIYKQDKSYTYNFYKIVGNKKKKISSKRYHEYMNRIKQKKKNSIPLILIKGGNDSIQYGGLKDTALNSARDMDDLKKRLRKYKNNPTLNLSNAYIVKHGITQNPDDNSLKINIEAEKKIKQLLKLTDFEFSTKFIYMDDENGNPKKYMVVIPEKKSVKTIQSYIENSFGHNDYNKFKIADNEGVITPQTIDEYFNDKDENTNRRMNHKEKVDKQIKKFDVFTKALGHYIKFLQSLNNLLGIKLEKIRTANIAFFKKNVDLLDTPVIFALITGAFAEPGKRGFYRTPNPVEYDVGELKTNYNIYKDVMKDHDYKQFARFIRTTLDNVEEFETNSKWYDPINNIDIGTINEYNWEEYVSKFDAYRTYLRKTFVPGVGKIQCGIIKVLDSYFELINERLSTIGRQFKSIKSRDIFKLQPSQICLNIQQGGKIQRGGEAAISSADANLNLIGVNKDAELKQELNQQLDLLLPGSNVVEKVEEKVDQVVEKAVETQNIKKALSEKEKEKLKALPNENLYYDVFRGFRKDDGFNPAKFVDFIQQILQYEISMTEIQKLKELNDKFEERLDELKGNHDENESKAKIRRDSYIIECKKFTTILNDTDIPIMKRLNKLKEYKEYVKKTATDNIEYQQNLEKSYASYNFDVESMLSNNINLEIEVLKQILNTSKNVNEPDYKSFSSGLIKLRKKYKSKFAPSQKEGETVKTYRFLEFYATIYKKLVIKKTETCDLYSAFNFEQIANCIHEDSTTIYKNYSKEKLNDMPTKLAFHQSLASKKLENLGFGYPLMEDIYKQHKYIHPFFYDEIEACITELKDKLTNDKERQDIITGAQLSTLKERKRVWKEELDGLKLETLMEEKHKKEQLKQQANEIVAKRAVAAQARQRYKDEIAEESKNDIEVAPSKNAPKLFRMNTLERKIKGIDKEIENYEASKAITETGVAMDKANNIQEGGLFTTDPTLKSVTYTSDLDHVVTIDKEQPSDVKKQVQNYMLNQRVFLNKDKYQNISYIYLLNASCRDFNQTSRIWQSTKNAVDLQIDVGFTNNLHIKAPKKELLTSNFGKKFDSGSQLEQNLEECAEYRLRYPRGSDDDFYFDVLAENRKELNDVQRITNAYVSDITKQYDMWTIQKNVSINVNAEGDIEENQWLDLAEIKIKAPNKLNTLDNMILSNNPIRRKRALKSLIKYVSWPDIPENYDPIKEDPFSHLHEEPPSGENLVSEEQEIGWNYKTGSPMFIEK